MGEGRDICSILERGSFPNSRVSRSAAPSETDSNVSDTTPSRPTFSDASQAATPWASEFVSESPPQERMYTDRTWRDPSTPRNTERPDAGPHMSRGLKLDHTCGTRRVPRPVVEDEVESLAKEFNSSQDSQVSVETVPSQGEVDQETLMEEVPEFNPERRFVLVSPTDDGFPPMPKFPPPRTEPEASPESYEANTGRKYDAKPSMPRQSSYKKPAVVHEDGRRDDPHRRARSKAPSVSDRVPLVDQEARDKRRPSRVDTYLEPEVIKHSTTGRDKSYHDYNKNANEASLLSPTGASGKSERSKSTLGDDRNRKRSTSRSNSDDRRYRGSLDRYADSGRYREDVPSEKTTSTYPPLSRTDRAPLRRHESERSNRKMSPPPKYEGRTSAEDDFRAPAMMLRKPTMDINGDDDSLVDPETITTGSKPKGRQHPDLRPRHGECHGSNRSAHGDDAGPRASVSSLPAEPRVGRRVEELPYPDSPRSSRLSVQGEPVPRSRSRSRMSTNRLSVNIPAPAAIPAGTSPSERRRSGAWSATGPKTPPLSASTSNPRFGEAGSFDPHRDAVPATRPHGSYRRFSEDHSMARMPECRRKKGVTGKTDWMTLQRCNTFNICPTCYEGVFANSNFRSEFVQVLRPMEQEIVCDFGSVPWYRIAWQMILKNRGTDLMPFMWIGQAMQNAYEARESCPGDKNCTKVWYGLRYPGSRKFVCDFDVCYTCASAVQCVFPALSAIFTTVEEGEPVRGSCAMHFKEPRKRFIQYFDTFETTVDHVDQPGRLSERELARLCKDIDSISRFAECQEDRPVIEGGWHIMRDLSHFTVCGDCFDEVVRPKIEDGNPVAMNFLTNAQWLRGATCQLYSRRMREVFSRACRKNDLGYLDIKARDRKEKEEEIRGRLEKLAREPKDRAVERYMGQLISDWKEIWE